MALDFKQRICGRPVSAQVAEIEKALDPGIRGYPGDGAGAFDIDPHQVGLAASAFRTGQVEYHIHAFHGCA